MKKAIGAGVCFALALLCLIAAGRTPTNPSVDGGGAIIGTLLLPAAFVVGGIGLLVGKARAFQAAGVLCCLLALLGAAGQAKLENKSGLAGETIGKYIVPFIIGLVGIRLFQKGRQLNRPRG